MGTAPTLVLIQIKVRIQEFKGIVSPRGHMTLLLKNAFQTMKQLKSLVSCQMHIQWHYIDKNNKKNREKNSTKIASGEDGT